MQHLKFVVVGDGAVGKTCLLYVFANNIFPEDHVPTVFDDYSANCVLDEHAYSLGLWDTAGQDEYNKMRPFSYNQTHVFLACFSCADKNTLENVKMKWIPEVRAHVQDPLIMMVGTKCDLRSPTDPNACTDEHIERVKKETKSCEVVLCSAKTHLRIDEVFHTAIRVHLRGREYYLKPDKKGCCTIL
ncbi:putative rho family small GTPase [Paratrimastix pyriformis]|uniref:Rho family small GTPase n=1 Tax=Paratrimastix pyriformis TaxID=342808 RepID=A0ABQ8URM4_9EUKA|nr:putative rho family small GTPase [Paratrimastix pyriformis]|eukprot:GAFH01004892.1.p1 GENE.GAFH01004892.1~~GAFH01004892.1.p1  ORF type:complete len:187 (+),score=17.31 GAFH01004892.1:31-591(+)